MILEVDDVKTVVELTAVDFPPFERAHLQRKNVMHLASWRCAVVFNQLDPATADIGTAVATFIYSDNIPLLF